MVFIMVIFTAIFVWLLFKLPGTLVAIEPEEGDHVLSYSPYIGWIFMALVIALALFVVLVGLLSIQPPYIKSDRDIYAIVNGVLFFAAAMMYIHIGSLSVRIVVGEKGMRGAFGLGGHREFGWDEIDHIAYSPRTMMYRISLKHKAPLRVDGGHDGIEAFQRLYMAKLPEEKWAEAHEAFKQTPRTGG